MHAIYLQEVSVHEKTTYYVVAVILAVTPVPVKFTGIHEEDSRRAVEMSKIWIAVSLTGTGVTAKLTVIAQYIIYAIIYHHKKKLH